MPTHSFSFFEWTIALLGMLVSAFFAYRSAARKSESHQNAYENLLRQDAASEEKNRLLTDDLRLKNDEIHQLRQNLLSMNQEVAGWQAKGPTLESQLQKIHQEKEDLKRNQTELQYQLAQSTAIISTLQTEKQLLEQQLNTLKESIDELKKQTKNEFENLAHQILDAKTKTFNEQTEKSLETLLQPLKEKIQTFEKSVDEKYSNEAKERHALKSEIERLISLNDRMATETSSLTQALRGDSKVQGDWGELVLERILEASGLREGFEYSIQKSHNNDEGDRFRPDIIINLPDNKHIIVDSKVSIKAYDIYRLGETEESKTKAINEHLKSIEKHIDDLGDKHYSKLKGVNSPELVFMFIPIEPAYLLAMHSDAELSTRAWKKGVAIVTATTLLTSLKTVASIWRLEKQNRNALEIAQEGAKLYDKFVGFLEDFEKIGNTLEQGQKQYSMAMGKLKDGPGNVFRKMELLRELGASPNKKIKPELLE